jgi:putative FmdB family regulatory protein
MPLYEYECTKCGHRFEVIQKRSNSPASRCPKCKGKVRKLLSAPAIHFKGSGWYVTDYGGKGKTKDKDKDKPADTAKPADAGKPVEAKSDKKTSDPKPKKDS